MTRIVAHRGASAHAPENTLAAIRLGVEHGADGIEWDVHLTADGVPVVLHDSTLQRTGGDPRECSSLSFADLRPIDVGSWKGPQFTGERVPSFAEALANVPQDRFLLIELKDGPDTVAPILAVLDASPRAHAEQYLMSFNIDSCAEAKRLRPDIPVMALIPGPDEMPVDLRQAAEKARSISMMGLGISDRWLEPLQADPQLFDHVFGKRRPQPLLLSVWTVDDPARAQAWAALGASMITTNDPKLIREAL